ncbi:MAG: valine--tRNA ligase [Candidatus Pacebacteria bacterium]|nr:valine--tRNA ligase [Candidatus Paceibacterota bacterium]
MENQDKNTLSEEFFPKSYDFKASEEKWRKDWEEKQLYRFDYNKGDKVFLVDTPPPYVSADHLHAGHIMSYTQAEFIVRYKRMRGYNVFYPMGFDDNGLPTERFVEKKYSIDKSKITKSEFIALCLKETEKGIETYKNLWNSLGISVDWSKTYSTIDKLPTKVSQWSILDLYKKGLIYKKELPILWCPFCGTAISQSDLETKERESKMNYIRFTLGNGQEGIIATTRPEMLPACVAVYYHPDDERYQDIKDGEATVPLFDFKVPIKTSEAVDKEKGTGLMMVCTWGDQEDLEKWRLDNLETKNLITEDGRLTEIAGKYQGMIIEQARKEIIKDLDSAGLLLKQESIIQSVNIHERCDTPVELVQSSQWFIKIAENKEKWLEMGKKINWYPEHMYNNYELWVNSLKWDWCISRQRYYGVPFPFWICQDCGEIIIPDENDLPVNPFEQDAPTDKCPKCGSSEIEPEKDVMDTWATSSCTPFLLREIVDEKDLFPVDLRPNAHEIIRTWDFYSIVKSALHFDSIPFKNVMISGHGLDEQGKKISKRLGNYTPSDKLVEEYGADAIRYWATGAGLGQNLRFNPKEIKKGKQITTKLWNVARFIMMYDHNTDKSIEPIYGYADKWIIEEMNKAIDQTTRFFEEYQYAKAKSEIEEFFMSKFADYYVEFVKYRLNGDDIASKNACLISLKEVFNNILKLYAPIIPFITEELYQYFKEDKEIISIHKSAWPEPINIEGLNTLDIADFAEALSTIDEIRKYKSENQISLGAELEKYELKTKTRLDKYGELISKVGRIKELS